jgi:hypothetical protein
MDTPSDDTPRVIHESTRAGDLGQPEKSVDRRTIGLHGKVRESRCWFQRLTTRAGGGEAPLGWHAAFVLAFLVLAPLRIDACTEWLLMFVRTRSEETAMRRYKAGLCPLCMGDMTQG